MSRIIRLASLALAVSLMAIAAQGIVSAQSSIEDMVLARAASDMGLSTDRLEIADLVLQQFPLTEKSAYRARVFDTVTGAHQEVVIDSSGAVLDYADLREAESAARQERYGKLDPALYELLQGMDASELISVALWLDDQGVQPLERTEFIGEALRGEEQVELGESAALPKSLESPQEVDAQESQISERRADDIRESKADLRQEIQSFQQANLDAVSDQIAAAQAPLLAELASRGRAPDFVSPYSPLIYVTVTKSEVLELAEREDVLTVYGPNEYRDLMDVAKPTIKADVVNSFGFDGTGIDVGILEDSRIQFNNPYLSGTTRVPADSNVDQHATATGGMVASQHSTYEGIAPGVNLFSANATTYGDSDLSDAMDWSVSQGLEVINNSWGGNTGNTNLNVHDRHLDYIVRFNYRTVPVAAGNEAGTCGSQTDRVTSPGRGFNVLSVGNYNDGGTITWGDDSMGGCSSFIDPSTGVEKPEIAAPGTSITSTIDVSPWIANVGSGTSYAAPMVSGAAALLMDRNATIEYWPEAVKAVMMATALNNIEGASRLSEVDGAGGIDVRAAFRVVDEGWWSARSVTSSSFPYTETTQWLYAGETIRAVIAWDSNPAGDYSTDPLEADLILRVYDPGDTLVVGSDYVYNNFEIVEFTAPSTGNYDFEVDDWSFTGTSDYVGFAVWPGHRDLTAYAAQVLNAPPVSSDHFRVDVGPFWNAVGIRAADPATAKNFIYLYSGSAFGDPADHVLLEDSRLVSSYPVDIVFVDRNHAPSQDYFAEVREYLNAATYPIEWATHTSDINAANCGTTYGPFAFVSNDVVRIWDVNIPSGSSFHVRARVTSGSGDLGMALMDSDPGDSDSYYQGISTAEEWVNLNGNGADEVLQFYNGGASDWMGFAVYNNNSNAVIYELDVLCDLYLPLITK